MMCMRQGHRSQARVLIADWDPNNAHSLASIMHKAGFKTAVAFNGKTAVAVAETFKPDLLVTEAYLDRLSGIHAAVRITAALPECKVLFLSSEASVDDIARVAPEELIYSYTAKPIHPLDLLNAIAYLLSAEWSAGDSAPAGDAPEKPAVTLTTGAAEKPPEATRNCVAEPVLYPTVLSSASTET
jgi:DNA-binding response OmpR family regulator